MKERALVERSLTLVLTGKILINYLVCTLNLTLLNKVFDIKPLVHLFSTSMPIV